ncbi:hypothetical protein B0J13DRAFT_653711 [Dactylonectria estremocensis]|uniref:Ubiquitin-like protease family profile domain-containing protein n=1 Tax=Dactylonectria estremocensis TaxID=1079267 RepID=A0A9P9D8P0_9HYPO|nr:hypothetical protein B0J13DRAFT_653711 [Dactylonectria estremocensis]
MSPDVHAVDLGSGEVFSKEKVDTMFQGAFGEALDKLDSEMGKVGDLQYLVVVGAAPASNGKVQLMIKDIASKYDTEVCFVHGEESSIDACKGAVIPWPKWTATGELQAACFGLAVQDSGSSAKSNNKGTDGPIEDIVLPSKLWGEPLQLFEKEFESIRIAPKAKSVTLFPVYLSLKEESVVLPKRSKDTHREAWSTKGATYMDPIKISFNAHSQGLVTYRFCLGSTAKHIILEVIHPLGYRRLEFVVSRERWRIVLGLCKDHSPSVYDLQNSIFAIGFGNSRAFKVVWDQVLDTCQSFYSEFNQLQEHEVVSVSSGSKTPGTKPKEHENLMACLNTGKRLTDEIINSYLEYILEKREDTLVLNTFFYIRLCEMNGGISDQEIWKCGLFSQCYRFAVIPIFNKSQKHWRIAVMCHIASAVSGERDGALPLRNTNTSQRPIVITMDSYFDEEMGVKQPLQRFLVQAAKIGAIPNEADNDLLEVRAQHLPKQDNDYDCGVYILGYMKLFFQDPDVAIERILAKKDLGWKLDASAERSAIRDTISARWRSTQPQIHP